MTDATWGDFLAPEPDALDPSAVVEGVIDAVVDAVAEAVTGQTWDDWTAAADPAASAATDGEGPTTGDEFGDLATSQADAELEMAANEIDEGNLEGAYDAVGNAQGFTDVAADAYDAEY